jgi:drug/metabolite transporter superfamily protein YnfA
VFNKELSLFEVVSLLEVVSLFVVSVWLKEARETQRAIEAKINLGAFINKRHF